MANHDQNHQGFLEVGQGALLSESLNPKVWFARRDQVRHMADRLASGTDVVAFHRLMPFDLIRMLTNRTATLASVHTAEMTCPAGSRFLPASRSICGRSPGLGCLLQDFHEHCLQTADGAPFPLPQRIRAPTRGTLSRELTRHLTMMLFNSEATRSSFTRHVGNPRHSTVVHPPILERSAAASQERDPNRLAFVGRLVRFKGAADAIRVAARLRNDTHLDVYGEGPERPQLEHLSSLLGIRARTTFHGWAPAEAVTTGLARAGTLLVPSRCFEAFGQIGPQAIQEGCPVVAYRSGGIPEWCLSSYGTLLEVGDIHGMVLAAEAWRKRLESGLDTTAWRREAAKRWGARRFAREYLRAIDSCADAGPIRPIRS